MAQYLSGYPGSKKRRIAERREQELLHTLRIEASPDRILRAAERLRQAMLYLIKARKAAHTRPNSQADREAVAARATREYQAWAERPVDEIVAEYRRNLS